MATVTFHSAFFPDGTSVGFYDATLYPTFPANGPPGTALQTVTAENFEVEATGLEDGSAYFAAAQVDGVWRYVRVETPAAESGGGGGAAAFGKTIQYAESGETFTPPDPEEGYKEVRVQLDDDTAVTIETPPDGPEGKVWDFVLVTIESASPQLIFWSPDFHFGYRGTYPQNTGYPGAINEYQCRWSRDHYIAYPIAYDVMAGE